MAFKSYRDASKDNWGVTDNTTSDPECIHVGTDQIKAGALQRIADATDLMAKNYIEMQRENERLRVDKAMYYRWYQKEENRNRSLRGVITKLKNKFSQK